MRSSYIVVVIIIIVVASLVPPPRTLARGFAALVPATGAAERGSRRLGIAGIVRAPPYDIPPRDDEGGRIIARPDGIFVRGCASSPLRDVAPGGGYDGDGDGGGRVGPDDVDVEAGEEPLDRIFRRAVVLQRMGDRSGCLREYEKFLSVARMHDVDPTLYAEVHANVGAIYAMRAGGRKGRIDGASSSGGYDDDDGGKEGEEEEEEELLDRAELRTRAKESFGMAVGYRPDLGSAWVNLALVKLSEGRESGANDGVAVKKCLAEARQCCERALGMDNDDERSRALAMRLIGDIDTMTRQLKRKT